MLLKIGIRGIMTIMGFRNTAGSQDIPWPSGKELLNSFNYLHTVEEVPPEKAAVVEIEVANTGKKSKKKSVSKLTVGGRAFCKHS